LQPDAALRQQGNAQPLHDQVPRKTAGILDDDRPDVITLDAVEEPCEPNAALDGIVATYSCIVKPIAIGNLETGALGKGSDCRPLPALRVFVRTDVGRRTRP
jgi:hypothetical protein